MHKLTHSFSIDSEKCRGQLACMRVCPTQAIRVRNGKAELLPDLCIDCGSCLRACPSGAISVTTRSLKDLGRFKYKVAVPSPALFGQFPPTISPLHIVEGLKSIGFDAVWIMTVEAEIVNRAIRDRLKMRKDPLPLISCACPVVVRLIQVAYPGMIEHLLHLEPPRELAGRRLRRKYAEELGISEDEIAAVYITSCQAKTISVLEPAEGGKSNLNGSIGISEIYNDILNVDRSFPKSSNYNIALNELLGGRELFYWPLSESQRMNLKDFRYMSLTGLSNIMQVFDDIEKGKLRNVDFLECSSCWGGCINGNLTVDNLYVGRSKLQRLIAELPGNDSRVEEEVKKYYAMENLIIKAPIQPRPINGNKGDLKERIKRIHEAEAVLASLPGVNCGLCGAPTCKTLAKDIATGDAQKTACIFYSKQRMEKLCEIYLKH